MKAPTQTESLWRSHVKDFIEFIVMMCLLVICIISMVASRLTNWRNIKRFMVWMRMHHIKNFVIFWLRVIFILIFVFLGTWVWFTDFSGLGWIIMPGCIIGGVAVGVRGYKPIKRLYKSYLRRSKSAYKDFMKGRSAVSLEYDSAADLFLYSKYPWK